MEIRRIRLLSRLCVLISILIVVLFSTSCSSNEAKNDFYSNADYILVNTNKETALCFQLSLFSKSKIEKVDFISFQGSNVSDLKVDFIDNTIDEIKDYKYKGLYTKVLNFTVKPGSSKDITINEALLKIDGKEKKITFKNPIKHTYSEGNIGSEEMMIGIIPNDMAATVINDSEELFTYVFNTQKDIELRSITIRDYLKPVDLKIKVDDVEVGNIDSLPLDIGANKEVKIIFYFSSTNDAVNNVSYLGTNLKFEYNVKGSSDILKNDFLIYFNPIYPFQDNDFSRIQKCIDKVVSD